MNFDEHAWDKDRLKRDRLDRIQQVMRDRGVGALFITDTVDIRFVFGVKIPAGTAFIPVEGEVVAFVRPRDMGYVTRLHGQVLEPLYTHSSTWGPPGSPDADPSRLAHGLRDLLVDHGLDGATLGVDEVDLPLLRALMDAKFDLVYARPIIEHARSVKTEDELAIYRNLGHQYACVFAAFRDAVAPGVTENDLVSVVGDAWREAGGEKIAQLNICSGENMNPWLRWPTDRPLAAGEFVGIDFHGHGDAGLRGDASRTYMVGRKPTGRHRSLYAQADDYLRRTMEVFRAGRSYRDAMAAVPEVPEQFRAQLQRYDIAHSIGMVPLGYPEVNPLRPPLDDTLKPGQVLSVECYFGEEGSDVAVKLEEMIVVSEGSPEVIGSDIPFDENFA